MKSLLAIFGIIVVAFATEGSSMCVPLSDCQHLLWMMNNKHNIPGQTASQVVRHIYGQSCGFQGLMPKVRCNVPVQDVEEDDSGVEPAIGSTVATALGAGTSLGNRIDGYG